MAALLFGLAIVLTLTGVAGLLSPPNNWDSMTYHLARVVHWIQDRNVSFYPTNIIRQLYMNPWAEFAIMHLQILSGGDRFANLVQWFSMIGCLVGASLLAKQLDGNLISEIFAAVFACTIPMGILQSSSTQNDYAVSFWLVCFVYFGLAQAEQRQMVWPHLLGAGFSLGLAILTKGTAYIFAFPFVVWIGGSMLRQYRLKSWKPAFTIAAVCLLLNLGQYVRNLDLFGSPLGPTSGKEGTGSLGNDTLSLSSVTSNLLRNIGLHLGTPSWRLTSSADSAIREIHKLLEIDINDPRSTFMHSEFRVLTSSFHEDSEGNFLHLSLMMAAIVLLLMSPGLSSRSILSYLIALMSGFLLFCALIKWTLWNTRYHLPLFVLASPFVGVVLTKTCNEKLVFVIAFALVLFALPWIILNRSRPLLGGRSIFGSKRMAQYFNNRPELRDPYGGAARFLESKKCSQIGLDVGLNDWEYPFWTLSKASANETIRIEHVRVTNASGDLSRQRPFNGFNPCAILSTRAGQPDNLSTEKGTYGKRWASKPVTVFLWEESAVKKDPHRSTAQW